MISRNSSCLDVEAQVVGKSADYNADATISLALCLCAEMAELTYQHAQR